MALKAMFKKKLATKVFMALRMLKIQKNTKIYRASSLMLKEEKNGTLSEKIYAANSHTWVDLSAEDTTITGMISSTIRVQACARGMLTRKVLRKGKNSASTSEFCKQSERQSAYKIQARVRGFWYVFLEEKKFTVKDLREKLLCMNSSRINLTSKSVLTEREQEKGNLEQSIDCIVV